jgi:hypothetical protein
MTDIVPDLARSPTGAAARLPGRLWLPFALESNTPPSPPALPLLQRCRESLDREVIRLAQKSSLRPSWITRDDSPV